MMKRIAVFCGSNKGKKQVFQHACMLLAGELFRHNISLVYGGGNIGLMGILADEMLRLGGKVIGVIPRKLVEIEVAHTSLTQLHIVADMHERKALMAELSDAFIVLPGGIGTLEEFFEVFTWLQLGYHNKPIGILNTDGFYDMMICFLEYLTEQGFFLKEQFDMLIIHKKADDLLNAMMAT
jgi:uncharacterized protein (TIGR00730 family)